MVGVAGFKPTTSPTPRVRANQAAPYSAIKKRDCSASLLSCCLKTLFYKRTRVVILWFSLWLRYLECVRVGGNSGRLPQKRR